MQKYKKVNGQSGDLLPHLDHLTLATLLTGKKQICSKTIITLAFTWNYRHR